MLLLDIRNELKATLKQLMDDREISDLQIDYWIKTAADTLRARSLEPGLEDQSRSGDHLRRFVIDIINDDEAQDRTCLKYVELPETIYDYELDLGVDNLGVYVSDCDGCPPRYVPFGRTTPGSVHGLYMSEDQSPSIRNPYFFRMGDRLYLLGLERSPAVDQVQAYLFTALPDIRDIDPNEDLPFNVEELSLLRKLVIENARVMLVIPAEDSINQGTSGSRMSQTALPKQVSVNSSQPSDQ